MPTALVVSLAVHAALLSIAVGGQAFGLPGLTFPWKERRVGADELRIQLAPAAAVAPLDLPVAASDLPPPVLPPVAAEPRGMVALAPAPVPAAASVPLRAVAPVAAMPDPAVERLQAERTAQEHVVELARVEREAQNAERVRETELIAVARREAARQAHIEQEAARAEAASRVAEQAELDRQASLRRAALQQERASQEEQARQQREQAAAAARTEAARQEQARQAQLETARQDAAQQEAVRREAARQAAARDEQARQQQALQEQARQEQAREERARQEQGRQELARQEQARQAQTTQAQAKQDLARSERAAQEAEREERLRAIGRQLNAEAAQRDAAAGPPSRSLLPGVSSLRRGWLFGRADANAQLVQYAETMGQKIELNMTFDMVRDVVKQPHVAPIVTMAIRADGSVEKVTFEVSSGVPAIDAAIRRVIASQAPYAAFPPALARQYDVIEIRRTWNVDTAIRLQ